LLVDRPWTPGDAKQWEGRLFRIGQKNTVNSIWLQSGEIDQKVDALLDTKIRNSSMIMSGIEETLEIEQIQRELVKELFGS
jgi:SNF2 family DNA or RNA helicase